MDIQEAIIAFDALSQETRLRVHRLLVEYGPDGVAAGELSRVLEVPHNTLSFHLNHMSHAGLVTSRRQGRSIIYSVNFEFVRDLIRFMVENCCNVNFVSMRSGTKRGSDVIELSGCCPKNQKERKS